MGVKEPSAAQLELFDSCKRGETEKVRAWLGSKKNKRPRTPLNFLRPSTTGSSWICSLRDKQSEYTALHLSALHGHLEICRLLIDADPHVTSAKDRRGCIPLHLAAWSGHLGVAQLLTNFEAESVDAINNMGESSLHLAAQCGYVKVVGVLLDKCSDARLRNIRSETALDIAAKYGHAPVVKILLSYCPELVLQSAADCSTPAFIGGKSSIVYPLHLAARNSHILCLQLLITSGFQVDFATDEGTALHVAALHGQVEAVRFLLGQNCNVKIRDSRGRTVLEALEEHDGNRSSDLTQVMSVKEQWRECIAIIKEHIACERGTLSSSSDSGFDRREAHTERRHTIDGAEEGVWLPLPETASVIFGPGSESVRLGSGSVRLPATRRHEVELTQANINRTWNSRLLRDAVNADGKVVPRFPLTSPNTKARHQSSKRTSDTLPLKFSVIRTSTAPGRSSILPGDSCVYRPPPTYESLPRRPPPASGYDNAGSAHERSWDHACGENSPAFSASVGPGYGRAFYSSIELKGRVGGTQTLPRGGMSIRERPSVLDTFEEEPAVGAVNPRLQELSLSDRHEASASRRSVASTSTFASFDERPASPAVLDTSLGVAPLAQPEEMIASVSNSLVSTRGTPERALSKTSSPDRWTTSLASPLSERTIGIPSISTGKSVSQDDLASLPSPNTSEMIISDALFSPSDKSLPPRNQRDHPADCHSPTATECSERTVASSCSIPTISNATSPSLAPSKRLGCVVGDGSAEECPLDERAAWSEIDSIMQSIGAPLQDVKEGGHQVVRDRNSKALTLLSTLNPKKSESSMHDETAADVSRFQTDALDRWMKSEVGLDAVDSATMALLLQRNGFDMVDHLQISLDRLALMEMGVADSITYAIVHVLQTSPPMRKYPQANDLNYVSEWLQSLDLQDYLGHFFRSGLKTMMIVRSTDLTQRMLNEVGVYKIGHVLRILHSLRSAKKAGGAGMNNNRSSGRLSLSEQLISGWVTYSAHFLGSVEISNVNCEVEAKSTMTRLKKALREISKVPQIRIEISVSGVRISDVATARQQAFHEISQINIVCQDERDLNCFTYITRDDDRLFCHVLCVLTADVATEIVKAFGQAFECASEQQNELQGAAIRGGERASGRSTSASRTIEC